MYTTIHQHQCYFFFFFYVLRLFSLTLSALARVRRLPKMVPLHTARSRASSLVTPTLLMSSITHSSHVFLPLPRPLEPSTSIALHADTQLSSLIRSTCPNHLSLLLLTTTSEYTVYTMSIVYIHWYTVCPVQFCPVWPLNQARQSPNCLRLFYTERERHCTRFVIFPHRSVNLYIMRI